MYEYAKQSSQMASASSGYLARRLLCPNVPRCFCRRLSLVRDDCCVIHAQRPDVIDPGRIMGFLDTTGYRRVDVCAAGYAPDFPVQSRRNAVLFTCHDIAVTGDWGVVSLWD